MDDDIVERLREHQDIAARVADAGWALRVGASGPEVAPNVFGDAADVIEAQQAEIKQLGRWRAEAMEMLAQWDAVADMAPARLDDRKSDAVAAEIIRLRQEINRLTALRIADSMLPQRHGRRKRRG